MWILPPAYFIFESLTLKGKNGSRLEVRQTYSLQNSKYLHSNLSITVGVRLISILDTLQSGFSLVKENQDGGVGSRGKVERDHGWEW